ncbi:phage terminase small subunit P27 family [Candidatus Williamhamiltonella defendens]|uniref:phage terminase small subunit P27 family n=1 Tax=Candidatus Williamhamiltonella defendens TaxID=138072 RepID=UPI001F225871|nr:phage terminase small subunit P27 family [Candidatus Hamiltonella defensa]
MNRNGPNPEKWVPSTPKHFSKQEKYWFERIAEDLNASDILTHIDGMALELLVGVYVEWRQHRDVIKKEGHLYRTESKDGNVMIRPHPQVAMMAVGLFMCSVNSDVFHAGVIQILLPSLPPDCVVVMDNATFHKRLDTQKVIDDAGHIIEYLPPYSPDLNPVEHKWAEAKSKRRAVNCSIDALFSHYMT